MEKKDNGQDTDLDVIIAKLLARVKSEKYYTDKKEQLKHTKKDDTSGGQERESSSDFKKEKE